MTSSVSIMSKSLHTIVCKDSPGKQLTVLYSWTLTTPILVNKVPFPVIKGVGLRIAYVVFDKNEIY